ncbi:lysM and putative peptidoglycan-binding domain-containing protein 3 [Sergentomyia squamirostris]
MKRTRLRNNYNELDNEALDNRNSGQYPMHRVRTPHIETLEAQIQENDTLQAIALRFNCPLSDLKRINKIEKDNEIFARSILRIPVTPHTVLLETLPGVHKSGASSPTKVNSPPDCLPGLDEKLLIASVSNSSKSINDIILNTKLTSNEYRDSEENGPYPTVADDSRDVRQPLLSGEIDDNVPQPRIIPVRHTVDDLSSCNGADCDISWICLFIFILILCFLIPLIYIIFKTEPEHEHHIERISHENHSKL